VLTLVLAALTILLGFEGGGYFADTTGWAAAGLALTLGVSALLSAGPLRSLTRALLLAASALALLALWTLLSAEWSGAWGRSLIEFDRVLLYLLALLLFAGARSPEWTLRRIPAAFALAALVLCASGVFVRTLPNSWPFALPPVNSRMDYPLGYENALGALAALGLVLSLHLASWRKEHPVVRVLAAAALPVFTAALALTYSRGAPAAAVVGIAAYVVLGLSRGMVIAVLAAGVPAALALNGVYGADLLGSNLPRSPAALAEGEDLAILIAWTAVAAAAISAVLMPLERRLPRVRLPRVKAWLVVPAVALALVAGTGLTLAIAGPDAFESLRGRVLDDAGQQQERRGAERGAGSRVARRIDLESESRPKYWRVSLDAFGDEPLKGSGAGSFAKHWARERTITEDVTEGHSLYLETLAELGLVGAVLLVVVLGAMLTPFVAGLRSRQRPLYAAFLAAGATWLVHAGLDWDWEMPVLGIWLFAAAGCALARSPSRIRAHWLGRWPARLAVAAGCVLLALTPGYVALSQARLDKAAEAFARGRCGEASQHARDAIAAVSSRAEPYELLAYCGARRGEYATAVRRMQDAIERDPGNWELLYGLAVVRAAGGLDPRPAARAALRLNPLDDFTQGGVERFATERPRGWRREARTAPLPLILER
jgi:O-antigen ligase/polysaccharide polymerase Wzy-like membrane protein